MNSYWINSEKNKEKYNKLEKNIETDICIIGGGITGISTAYYLTKENLKVTVLDMGKIGFQTTGNSTAKITSQHGLFYKYLKDSKGEDFARLYYDANEDAIKNIKKIVEKENIECDLECQSAYVLAANREEVQKVKDEVEVVRGFGGHAEYLEREDIDKNLLILNPLAAIRFKNQAQFNSYKYTIELAKVCKNLGANIYENTKVVDVRDEKDYYYLETEDGYKIKAKYLVITTKYPIINIPGFYFMKMYQSTSYGISIPVKEKLFDGMYITSTNPKVSLRMAKVDNNIIKDVVDGNIENYAKQDKENRKRVKEKQNSKIDNEYVLIVVGADHKTGEKTDLSNSYKKLENIAKQIYSQGKVENYWNTEDCITLDKIPYIGKYSTMWENAYVATGFNKWGITTSNIAANIITDMIIGRKNRYEDIFISTRVEPVKNRQEVGNMLKETVSSLVLKKFELPESEQASLKNEEGKIIEIEGEKVGAYKDKEGRIYTIVPKCAHLGCELSWNNLEKTWDCPCHGSRYDYTGKMLYGPTVKDLYIDK
ncbi:MAG: FAD-dependent oxidoreductase [Clostridia bacterium]|nr:FAD-dependent oxidoreductase [Clostridia bacterium]